MQIIIGDLGRIHTIARVDMNTHELHSVTITDGGAHRGVRLEAVDELRDLIDQLTAVQELVDR